MQPQTAQKPGTALSSARVISFSRFIQKAREFVKKDESPTARESASSVPSTFDRSRRHNDLTEADLKRHADALQKTLDSAWPHRHHSRYRSVHGLLVCWGDNDSTGGSIDENTRAASQPSTTLSASPTALRFSDGSTTPSLSRISSGTNSAGATTHNNRQGPFVSAARQLANVLERRYAIQSQVWMIPLVADPQDALLRRIKSFVNEYGAQDNLLVFWYGGRAEFVNTVHPGGETEGESSIGELIWYGLRDRPGISARVITKALGNSRADVFMLNDSPFSQHAYMGRIIGPGSFELLGSGSTTPSNMEPNQAREASFTRTLALMLDSPFLASRGVSVVELHRKLLDNMSVAASRGSTASMGTVSIPPTPPTSATTGTETETETATAIAGHRDSTKRPNSALIVSKGRAVARLPMYPVYCQISQAAALERDVRRNIVLSRLDTSLAAEIHYARMLSEPRVRLDIKLLRPYLDVRRWKEWVLRAPSDAEAVNVDVHIQRG